MTDVSFTTDDGLELHGWYVPSKNRAAVIAFPGRKGPQRPARMLVRHGYGVLLFDRRGEGDSEGDPNAVGWNGDRDIKAAIAFLHKRPDVDPERIGGIGLSVGGELMLETAAETDQLKAVMSDGAGIRSVREANVASWGSKILAVPVWGGITVATAVFSDDAPPPNLNDLVADISPRSVFFVYAERGQGGEDLSPGLLRVGEGAQVRLEGAGREAHRGNRDAAARVRAANDRLLRRRPARLARLVRVLA